MARSLRAWRVVFALTDSTASAMESTWCMLALTRKLKTCFWNSRISISIALIICVAPLGLRSSPLGIIEAQQLWEVEWLSVHLTNEKLEILRGHMSFQNMQAASSGTHNHPGGSKGKLPRSSATSPPQLEVNVTLVIDPSVAASQRL